ncbi:hypothetical protein KP509_06G052800 [Ceratopteris richardii]|uniref:F-box domain-containing protein n=1 Tax=Ceratopteris richardii TaxID=49495 RepID=A0A8T2UI65_CERRI|nr:hypothetical protein KP509_06G052800 [Ceratopteris richardii]
MGWTVEALPDDVMHNIMTRVPIDSLVRCAAVCKSWYASIRCAKFCSSIGSLHPPPHLLYVWGLDKSQRHFALIYNPFSNTWHEIFKSPELSTLTSSSQPMKSESFSLRPCPLARLFYSSSELAILLTCQSISAA